MSYQNLKTIVSNILLKIYYSKLFIVQAILTQNSKVYSFIFQAKTKFYTALK